MQSNKKLRIGIVGCGSIFTMHATSISNLESVELVAICDVKPERLEYAGKTYKNAVKYADYEQMILNEKLDAVHVCTPHYLHVPIAKFCLENGVNVLTEKPMSIAYEDAAECVKLAADKKLQYGVIFQSRYNTVSVKIKQHLTSGELGKVISARVVLTWSKPDEYYTQSDWKGTWAYEGGGVLIDQAIHSLDLANWFIQDEFEWVKATLNNRYHNIMKVDDTAEGFIKYKKGATLSFWVMNNYGTDEPIEIRLHCEGGDVILSYDDATVLFGDGRVLKYSQENDKIEYKDGKDYWGFQHIKQIRQFYAAVRGDEKLEISGAEALKIQKLVMEIYKVGLNAKALTI